MKDKPLYRETFNSDDGITMKEYFNQRIDDLEDKLVLRFDSIDKALNLATGQMDKRLEGMNEFRDQLKDQAQHFLTREVYETACKVTQTQIDDLRLSKATIEGKASQASVYIAWLLGFGGLILGILSYLSKVVK
jgi:hypothetical protein